MKKLIATVLPPVLLFATGCETLNIATKIGATIAVVTGDLSVEEAESVCKVTGAADKAWFDKISPYNEYYIGRAVTALALKENKPLDNEGATHYLNVLGQTLAKFSDKPETYGGYHFMMMQSDEINAFAAPGGFIVVSRGLLKCCKSEDALAGVLAHEIGHVQNDDALRAISGSRWTSLGTVLVAEGAKNYGGQELAELTTTFEGALNDVSQRLFVSGYASGQEYDADGAAVTIMKRAGYSPAGLREVLAEIERLGVSSGQGFFKTHPKTQDRIKRIEPLLKDCQPLSPVPARQSRFDKLMAGI